MNKKQFQQRLRAEIKLRIRELRDGCLECRAIRGLCNEHYQEAVELILTPRKRIKFNADGIVIEKGMNR